MTHPELSGDWHVHSSFSDDADSTIRENLDAAAAAGITTIRLTEHVRADTTWVPEFVVIAAAAAAASPLEVRTGVEAKILDAAGTLDIPADLAIGTGGVDGVVIADHQFPGPDGPWSPSRTRQSITDGLKVSDAVDMVVVATIRAMERAGGGAQLAHPFSILPKIGADESDLTDEHLTAWAAAAAATGTGIEVNEKWGCPSPRAVRAAIAAGAILLASTDSHRAVDVGRYSIVTDILSEARA